MRGEEQSVGIAKQGGPWRIQFSLTEDSTFFFLLPVSNLTKKGVGAFGCSEHGNRCCRQAERGIGVERCGGQDTLVSLAGHSWQLVVLCVCLYRKTFGW